MLKVLIVEDELLVRTSLKLMINWEQHGYTICGEALNGQESLKALEIKKPHIVLSDIRMPVMDGSQLSREIHLNYPNIKLIMLSNYDDYDYVANTLKNGAVDYILKHRLNAAVLLDALRRATQYFKPNKEELTDGSLEDREKNKIMHMLALKENFAVQLLTGYFKDGEEIKAHMGVLGLDLEVTQIVPIIMEVDDYNRQISTRGLKEEALVQFAIINIVEEILLDHGNGVICHVSNGRFIIMSSFSKVRSRTMMDDTIKATVSRIDMCLKSFAEISASFSVGGLCGHILSVPASYERAVYSLKDKFYKGKNIVVEGSAKTRNSNVVVGLNIEIERQIIANIKHLKPDKVMQALDNLFNQIIQDKLSLTSSQMMFNELLGIINRICRESHLDMASIYSDRKFPHESLAEMETLEEIREWMVHVYTKLLDLLSKDKKQAYTPHIRQAVAYMEQHFHQDVSLAQVAEQIGIHNTYLSTQFKDEVGIGFSEYLNELRLERAKALILEGKLELKEIVAGCGFNNYAYFFQVFKRRMGITPKEFLHSLSG